MIENFYKNKKVLITGHTGFKGSWLSLMLYNLNAKVSGLSDSSINSGFYSELKKENIFQEELIGNINDYDFLKKNILKKDFDIIFHFAAQGIVSKAKEDVNETLMTNIFGTYNICKISNLNQNIKTLIIATTDKVYADHNDKNTEEYKLGGAEFYSASKASSEHIINAFNNTEKRTDLNIGVVRSGNVLGGGDYGKDRILTDIITALKTNSDLHIRNPLSVRPWQYILDSLNGYLKTGLYCSTNQKDEIFNLNVELINKFTVEEIINLIVDFWNPKNKLNIKIDSNNKFLESDILTINSEKAKKVLNWESKFNVQDMCKEIVNYEKSNQKFKWANEHVLKFLQNNQ